MNLVVNSVLDGLYLIVAAISNLFVFLPDVSISSSFASSVSTFAPVLFPLLVLVNVDVLSACLITLAVAFSGLMFYRLIKFIRGAG